MNNEKRKYWITEKVINLDRLLKETNEPQCGACVVFLGTVRNNSENGTVKSITYEVHKELAIKVIRNLEKQIEKRYKDCRCRIVHRVGYMKVGEASVAIVVRTPHREDAYQASRYAIEKIKKIVPIWKREHTSYGKGKWIRGNKLESINEGYK